MPISKENKKTMKDLQEARQNVSPEQFIEPDEGWQCPSCGQVYEQEGLCPVDETALVEVKKWTESVDRGEKATTEEVMETAQRLYPTGTGRPSG